MNSFKCYLPVLRSLSFIWLNLSYSVWDPAPCMLMISLIRFLGKPVMPVIVNGPGLVTWSNYVTQILLGIWNKEQVALGCLSQSCANEGTCSLMYRWAKQHHKLLGNRKAVLCIFYFQHFLIFSLYVYGYIADMYICITYEQQEEGIWSLEASY